MQTIPKPQAGEFVPYASGYIDLVPDDGCVMEHLAANLSQTEALLRRFPPALLTQPFSAGEWTLNEIVLHVVDSERIFAYRALRIARGDTTALPGFEQDDYIPYSRANERSLDDILEEFAAVRQASITLFKNLDEAAFTRQGTASGNPLSVRAALYIIVGHELHHVTSINANYVPLLG